MASEVLPVASWEEHGPDVDRWMAKPGKPLQQLKAAASLLEGERAVPTQAWIERCEALLQRRHRIVHGVFGRLMFGFGRRDNPEVLDVAGIEELAAELHLAGLERP